MIRNICCILTLALGLGHTTYAQLRPTVSILSNYTVTNGNDVTTAGAFDVKDKKLNTGFELSNKFYLGGNYFIKTGLRYNHYKTTVGGKNQQPAFLDRPYPLYWERRYESLSVPALFGKDFITANDNRGDYFIGLSAGVLSASYSMGEVSSSVPANPNNPDGQSSEIVDKDGLPTCFFPTFDFGASYTPFKFMPRFSVGVLCSVQLNKADPYSYTGRVRNETTGTQYNYNLQRELNFINCAFTLNYTFGKEKSFTPKKVNKLNCPR